MKIEDFTDEAGSAIVQAVKLSQKLSHQFPDVEHLVYSILDRSDSEVVNVLRGLGANIDKMKERTQKELDGIPSGTPGHETDDVTVARRLLLVLEEAKESAQEKGSDFTPLSEVFLAILSENPPRFCSSLMSKFQIDVTELKSILEKNANNTKSQKRSSKNKFLKKYARNMIDLARSGEYAPVIGRDFEIRRLVQILCRKSKNNPILAGHPGVGKTAIVEEMARRISQDQVPDGLRSASLYSLNMSSLMAGTKHRGDLEDRVEGLINEIEKSSEKIILFIDEIHLINQPSSPDSSIGNLLKPALSRGNFMCIGATTFDEYRQRIEGDGALSRRFQPIFVDPSTSAEALGILRGIRETYEAFHGMQIRDEALVSAVELSERYIADRFLPDKAIDLLDEACARVRANNTLLPHTLEKINQMLLQSEIKIASLERERDSKSLKDLEASRKDHADLKEQADKQRAQFESEKSLIARYKKCKSEVLKLDAMLLDGEAGGVHRDAYYRIKTVDRPKANAKLKSAERGLAQLPKEQRMLKDEITSLEIGQVVSAWTGIPATKLSVTEKEKLRSLPDDMKNMVISQDSACDAICDAVIRNRVGLSEEGKPIGSFLMLGPSGVGKTETAKTLSHLLFDDRENMVRIDMSEYAEKHTVSRLIGSPPGYIGYDQGGQLTEAVRRKPFSVVLFDEIEKAHPSIFDIFLQILDEGHLTDSQGRKVNFKNCVIIMTSNFGSKDLLSHLTDGIEIQDTKQKILEKLRKEFRPELINRIDDIVFFDPLAKDALKKICRMQLANLKSRIEKSGMSVVFSEEVAAHVVEATYDPPMGARPIKRFLQSQIEPKIAKQIIKSDEKELSDCLVEVVEGKINCTMK